MDNKCTKYESLFIFSDSETLQKHVDECQDCKEEQEIQKKVSSLLDEVKFYYYSKTQRRKRLRAVCILTFLMFSMLSLGIATNNEDLTETLMYGSTLSAEELGFPVDSYGLLMVDE